MPRATWIELIAEVRAQLDVSDDQAYAWLIDRARVMNAEAAWLLKTAPIPLTGSRYYELPPDAIWVEAAMLGALPYQRSTLHALDVRYSGASGYWRYGVYAEGIGVAPLPPAIDQGELWLQIHPDATGAVLNIRYVSDLPNPDDRTLSPPFPIDLDEALVDGAIAIGLGRMDERFDSSGYYEERFTNAIGRLRRRRHGAIGRGPTSIRMVM